MAVEALRQAFLNSEGQARSETENARALSDGRCGKYEARVGAAAVQSLAAAPRSNATDGDQKETRAPKRHWRDWFGPVVPVMKPKLELLMSLVGLAKFAWLVAFSASARN